MTPLRRSPRRWAAMDSPTVAGLSKTLIAETLADAQHDIAALSAELERLRAAGTPSERALIEALTNARLFTVAAWAGWASSVRRHLHIADSPAQEMLAQYDAVLRQMDEVLS